MDHYYQIKDLFGEAYTDPMLKANTTLGYFAGLYRKSISLRAGVPVEDRVLQGWPHGFGAGDSQWIKDFDIWVTNLFEGTSQSYKDRTMTEWLFGERSRR